jgi:hypothetical protein
MGGMEGEVNCFTLHPRQRICSELRLTPNWLSALNSLHAGSAIIEAADHPAATVQQRPQFLPRFAQQIDPPAELLDRRSRLTDRI